MLTFDLILIGGRGRVMDYTCVKVCEFSHFGLVDKQTDRQTQSQTDADERLTPATVINVSNEILLNNISSSYKCISVPLFVALHFK